MTQIEFMLKLYELLYELLSAIIDAVRSGKIPTTY